MIPEHGTAVQGRGFDHRRGRIIGAKAAQALGLTPALSGSSWVLWAGMESEQFDYHLHVEADSDLTAPVLDVSGELEALRLAESEYRSVCERREHAGMAQAAVTAAKEALADAVVAHFSWASA